MSPARGSSTKCGGMQGSTRPRALASWRIPHLRLLPCQCPFPPPLNLYCPGRKCCKIFSQHEAEVAAKGTLPWSPPDGFSGQGEPAAPCHPPLRDVPGHAALGVHPGVHCHPCDDAPQGLQLGVSNLSPGPQWMRGSPSRHPCVLQSPRRAEALQGHGQWVTAMQGSVPQFPIDRARWCQHLEDAQGNYKAGLPSVGGCWGGPPPG